MKSRVVNIDQNELIQSVNHDLSLNSMKASVLLLKSARTIKDLWNTLALLTEDLRNTLRPGCLRTSIEFSYRPEKEKQMTM
jgi:hypothetical protein